MAQKWDYLGQERQDELGLNWVTFRHRNADPALGRFFGVDPVSEDYMSISTYQFAHNNPVWKIELEGLEGVETSGLDISNMEPVKGHTNVGSMAIPIGDGTGNHGSSLKSYTINTTSSTEYRSGNFSDSDFKGNINPASDAMYNRDPAKAVLMDATFIVLDLLGANAVDDAIATANDPNASTSDVVEASVNAVLAVGLKGKGKTPAGRPGKTIANKNGVKVQSYGTNDVHKPAHAHVIGGGKEVRVGANGKPLKGQSDLTTKQQKVVTSAKKEIRKEVNKVGRANKRIEDANRKEQ